MISSEMVPYIYGIFANINFIIAQIFFKILTAVIPTSIVLSIQSFFLLIFNTFVIVSDKKYRVSYAKYNINSSNLQEDQIGRISVQNQDRLEINIKDPHIFRLVCYRLLLNVIGIWVLGLSIQAVPLSIVNAFINTAPIMIFFIEAIFYQKPLNKLHLVLTVISFSGVVMIVDPFKAFFSPQRQSISKIILPLLAALLASLGYIYLHQLKGKVNQFIVMEYGYICQTLCFHFMTNFVADDTIILQTTDNFGKYFQPSIFNPYCVLAFIMLVIFAYLANIFRIKSLFRLKPSKIIPFNYIGIVLSILIDATIFGHKSSFMEIIGILLTSVGLLSHFILAIKQGEQKDQS